MGAPGRVLRLRGDGQPARAQDNVSAVLDPLAEAVGATPIMGAAPPPWVTLGIISTSGYTQVATGSNPFLPQTAYHVDALGYVHGKIAIETAAGAAANTAVTTIAAGARPSELIVFVASDGGGLFWDFSVGPDGTLTILPALAAGDFLTGTFTYLAEH